MSDDKAKTICPRCQWMLKDKKGRKRKLCAVCASKVTPRRRAALDTDDGAGGGA